MKGVHGVSAMRVLEAPAGAAAKYAFYPGCSLESSAWDYDLSTRAVCRALGIELVDIPKWVCCGSTPAHASNASLALALPAINLHKAQGMGLAVLTACASCYSRLRTANHHLRESEEERQRVERITGTPYDGGVEVVHILDVLANTVGTDGLRANVRQSLGDLKVACYYGCLLTRPPEVVAFDNPEQPTCMESMAAAVGAVPVTWPFKTECCGAGLSITNSDVVCRLGHRLLSMAHEAGAECLVVGCPLCQLNLDLRQQDAAKAFEDTPRMPVVYLAQLVGLALGLTADELGLSALSVGLTVLLDKRQAALSSAEVHP